MKNRYSALLLLCAASLVSGCFMLQTTVHQPKPKPKNKTHSEATPTYAPSYVLQQRDTATSGFEPEFDAYLPDEQPGLYVLLKRRS
ncbi:MAG: hypothetical protein CO187_07940 [Zetaproteobacteria bacterium CG_4_9_14_3_um_filter_53_7]|nr:MAG: hypothetical protein CO187_07940 [Zetaproteobacteria bacterium CG_4_9_14_3_um_filter_53_7]